MSRRTRKHSGGAKFNPRYAHGRHVTEKKKLVEELKRKAREAKNSFYAAKAKLAKAAKENNMLANLFGKMGVSAKKTAKKAITKKSAPKKSVTRKQSRVSKFKQAELNAAAEKLMTKPSSIAYNRASRAAKRGLSKLLRAPNDLEELFRNKL